MHNHIPLRCIGGCQKVDIDPEIAHMAHYRDGCNRATRNTCGQYTKPVALDTAAFRFKEELIRRVGVIKETLGLEWP